MNEIVLTGCDESHFPIGAMAAFGVLRVLTWAAREAGQSQCGADVPALSWRDQPRWMPVLHAAGSRDDIVRTLAAAAGRASKAPVWTTHRDLKKIAAAAYRDLLEGCAYGRDADLSAAFACEWPTRDDKLMLTPFFMTSGKQQWCETIRVAAAESDDYDAIEEALFGPWRYAHRHSALGWDPATERQHALEAQAPEKESFRRAVGAAVWLAAESLALFPSFSMRRRLRVPCFDNRGRTFFWPTWRSPLAYDAVRAALSLPLERARWEADREDMAAAQRELRARGISAAFASRRTESVAGRGYSAFRPAELVWSS